MQKALLYTFPAYEKDCIQLGKSKIVTNNTCQTYRNTLTMNISSINVSRTYNPNTILTMEGKDTMQSPKGNKPFLPIQRDNNKQTFLTGSNTNNLPLREAIAISG